MSTEQQTPETTHTPHTWERKLGYEIISWDGFRDLKNTDLITETDFRKRAVHTTQNLLSPAQQIYRLTAERDAARAEAKTHKQTIDAVIVASKWDGCDGLAKFIEQIRIEKDEAQQWIDSEPDWKDKYNAQMVVVIAERDAERLARQAAEKERDEASQVSPTEREGIECHISTMLSDAEQEELGLTGRQLHMQVLRILSAYRNAADELATLRATLATDHGAAIEAAARSLRRKLRDNHDGSHLELIQNEMRALVTTVTNSQQKGGESTCATLKQSESAAQQQNSVAANSAVASNAAPTSDPEGAATLLPCPFCGSAPNSALRQSHDEFGECEYAYHEIECTERTCGMRPLVNETLEQDDGEKAWEKAIERAVTAWNRRAATQFPSVTETAKEIKAISAITELREKLVDLESFAAEETERVKAYDAANAGLRVSIIAARAGRDAFDKDNIALRAECERLRKALEELREVTQELVKLAEVWTPEFTRTIHNARCVLIDAASETKGKP